MKHLRSRFLPIGTAFVLFLCAFVLPAQAQQTNPNRSRYDITNYRIAAQLIPSQHLLRAGADVTLTPLEATRSLVFELNGSLKVESIEQNGTKLTNFVQDSVGADSLGPNVRVDLGQVVPANTPVTLRFKWSGALVSPEGGPLATRRLAYVGPEGSYLMYAARWFPFHDYAADRATADITIIVPNGTQVAGFSEQPVSQQAGRDGNTTYHFVYSSPGLIGNFAAGQFISKSLHYGKYDIQFNARAGSENRIEHYGEVVGKALDFYTQKYGTPLFGSRFVVAQIDDESLDAYSAPGMLFVSSKMFDPSRSATDERLEREVAYQWWGQSVGLKTFDDAWLSQGFAEWSAFALREASLSGGALDNTLRDEQERALTFEQTASIARAPAVLDDQSAAYQSIVFYKGAMVLSMLRSTMGQDKFDRLMRTFFEQYRGKNATVDDFEKLASQINGDNLRFFFAQWVEGTGVPEFSVDYQIIRTRAGKFRTRGTVKQNIEALNMPVDLMLRTEGGENKTTTVVLHERSEDFDFESKGPPLEVVVDPNNKILRMSDDLRVAVVARKGIEQFREGQYAEAQQQLEAAVKLDRSNSWVYYNLGLLFLEQRNWAQALDNFGAALNGNKKPSWIEVWAHIKRGNAYDAKGDRNRAVAEYNQALQSGINYDNAQAVAKKYLATPYNPRTADASTVASSTN
jgi:aminopeptidase N